MRKYVEIEEEVLKCIMEGKYVKGSLHYNEQAKRIDFNYYKRKERVKDKLIAAMEHGWLKESTENFKFFISLTINYALCINQAFGSALRRVRADAARWRRVFRRR